MTVPHTHDHNDACTHGSAAPGCRGAEAGAAFVPAFRTGRSYKVQGMDCAEEVAVLKQAVGPLVGGVDRLAFDVLNGRMTVADVARGVPEKAIVGAVASTGMSAVPWAAQAIKDRTDNHRRHNDAPALARANLGIAMGAIGSDAAIETADIALMTDDLSKLPWLVRHAQRTLCIIR